MSANDTEDTTSEIADSPLSPNASPRNKGVTGASAAQLEEVRHFMRNQVQYSKQHVRKKDFAVQCKTVSDVTESVVVRSFLDLVSRLTTVDFDSVVTFSHWAQRTTECILLSERQAAIGEEVTADLPPLLVEFCVELRDYLELHGFIRETKETQNLKSTESIFRSPEEQIVEQANRIEELETLLKQAEKSAATRVAQLEAKHRERIRFEVHHAIEESKKSVAAHASKDKQTLNLEIAALTNKLAMKEAQIDKLNRQNEALVEVVQEKEHEVHDVESAFIASRQQQEQGREDLIRDAVQNSAKVDGSINRLNAKVGFVAATVLKYTEEIKNLEIRHQEALQCQSDRSMSLIAELRSQVQALEDRLLKRDAAYMDLLKEHREVTSTQAARMARMAKAHSAYLPAVKTMSDLAYAGRGLNQVAKEQKPEPIQEVPTAENYSLSRTASVRRSTPNRRDARLLTSVASEVWAPMPSPPEQHGSPKQQVNHPTPPSVKKVATNVSVDLGPRGGAGVINDPRTKRFDSSKLMAQGRARSKR